MMAAVTAERSGAGDPARTLALLWGQAPTTARRGPSRALDVPAIVGAATDLARQEGLAAVTMRAVARALGVVPMTLYTYVPGKEELLDLMLDAAYAAMPRTDTAGAPWRERLTAVAAENRALFAAHPWAAEISTLRPPLGPGLMAKYEHELSAFDDLGLSDVERDDCLTYLLSFVQANARAAREAAAAAAGPDGDDSRWWARVGPLLARVLDEKRYPRASRVGTAAGQAHGSAHNPDHAYHFGLARLLDGLAPLLERR
jgi:AcrR family transcriptional regulator